MSEATLSGRDRVPKDTGDGAVSGCGRGRMWGEGLEGKGECLLERKGKDAKERQGPQNQTCRSQMERWTFKLLRTAWTWFVLQPQLLACGSSRDRVPDTP